MKHKMKHNMKRNNHGFSLVEVLIAMAIFVLCAAPLLRAFVLSSQTNVKSREALNAVTLAENIMEEIKASGVESYGTKTGAAVVIDGNALPVYAAKYPSYHYDSRTYIIEAEMTPSTETYQDSGEKSFNSVSMTDLYQMDRKRDAIYVQGQDDLWEIAKNYLDTHTLSSSITTQRIVDETETEYRFVIHLEHGFYTVEQTITHVYDGEELQEMVTTMKIFDSVQTGEALRSLYVFFLPSQSSRIIIENQQEVPLNVYLVKQGTGNAAVELKIVEGSTPEPVSDTRIRTNLAVSVMTPEVHKVYRNSDEKTLLEAKTMFGLDVLAKDAEVTARLYTVTVDVKDKDGNLLTTLTGTALK